jgi:hypothetical protein
MRAIVLSTTATAFAFFAATAAALPFPGQRAGSGTERTAGGGTFAGAPFTARSAAVEWDEKTRLLTLYLFERSGVRCSNLAEAIAIRRGRSVQVLVTRRAQRLPVNRPVRGPFVRFVRRFGATDAEIQLVQQGVELRLTRVDTGRAGVWHGHLNVTPRSLQGKRYSYAGTFAARWCP